MNITSINNSNKSFSFFNTNIFVICISSFYLRRGEYLPFENCAENFCQEFVQIQEVSNTIKEMQCRYDTQKGLN